MRGTLSQHSAISVMPPRVIATFTSCRLRSASHVIIPPRLHPSIAQRVVSANGMCFAISIRFRMSFTSSPPKSSSISRMNVALYIDANTTNPHDANCPNIPTAVNRSIAPRSFEPPRFQMMQGSLVSSNRKDREGRKEFFKCEMLDVKCDLFSICVDPSNPCVSASSSGSFALSASFAVSYNALGYARYP